MQELEIKTEKITTLSPVGISLVHSCLLPSVLSFSFPTFFYVSSDTNYFELSLLFIVPLKGKRVIHSHDE